MTTKERFVYFIIEEKIRNDYITNHYKAPNIMSKQVNGDKVNFTIEVINKNRIDS